MSRVAGTGVRRPAQLPGCAGGARRRRGKPPYKAPPKAPVLYVKPANTWIGAGAPIPVAGRRRSAGDGRHARRRHRPHRLPRAGQGARSTSSPATRSSTTSACRTTAIYRPSVRLNVPRRLLSDRPLGHRARDVPTPMRCAIRVYVDGALRAANTTANLVRPIARLLADVTEFMTLSAGDVLLTGVPTTRRSPAPVSACASRSTASARSRIRSSRKAATGEARARRVCRRDPRRHRCRRPAAAGRRADRRRGRRRLAAALPPSPARSSRWDSTTPTTRRSSRSRRQDEPLVFLKGAEHARRPPRADAPARRRDVHALRVRARGRDRPPARHVPRADAYEYVAGYTVANDYAIRDYLENYYRPNLRVKNRDTCTRSGRGSSTRADVPDPMQPRAAHDRQRQGDAATATRAT